MKKYSSRRKEEKSGNSYLREIIHVPSLKEAQDHGRGFSWCVMVKRRSISFRAPRHREESVARPGSFWLIGQYSLLAPRGSCITRRDVEKLPDWDALINNPRVLASILLVASILHACNYPRNATRNNPVSWFFKNNSLFHQDWGEFAPVSTRRALWFIAGMIAYRKIGGANFTRSFQNNIPINSFRLDDLKKIYYSVCINIFLVKILQIDPRDKRSSNRRTEDVIHHSLFRRGEADARETRYPFIKDPVCPVQGRLNCSRFLVADRNVKQPTRGAARSPCPWTWIVLWRPSATPVMRLAKKNSRARREERRRWSGSPSTSRAKGERGAGMVLISFDLSEGWVTDFFPPFPSPSAQSLPPNRNAWAGQ